MATKVNICGGITVGGFHYEVDLSETAHRMLLSDGDSGQCDCRNKVISVDCHEDEVQISKTFIHEVIEVVNYTYCDSKLDHEKIQQLSFGIHQALESLGVRFGGKIV